MPDSQTTADRIVFGMEVVQGSAAATSYVSVIVRGGWDMGMVDGLTSFIMRQRKRMERRGPLMLTDIWEDESHVD